MKQNLIGLSWLFFKEKGEYVSKIDVSTDAEKCVGSIKALN